MSKIIGIHTAGTVGHVLSFTGSVAPSGTLICDGSAVSRTTYAQLFALIGVTHGQGDGSTTFNLPDYRGRFLRGVDGVANNDPDKASRTAMNPGGNTGDAVGSVQSSQFVSHTHTIRGNNAGDISAGGRFLAISNVGSGSDGPPSNSFIERDAGNILNSGGNETRPLNANVNYCICYN